MMNGEQILVDLQRDRYPKFEANQVLTSRHLNDMMAFLEQQDRYTREKLIGTGIVNGLIARYRRLEPDNASNKAVTVTVSPGAGITTFGYLLHMGPEAGVYTKYQETQVDDYPLLAGQKPLELLPETATGDEVLTLTEEELTNRVAVLYLDLDENDLRSCFSTSCDDRGKEVIFNLRVLLVDQTAIPAEPGSDGKDIIEIGQHQSLLQEINVADWRVVSQGEDAITKGYQEVLSTDFLTELTARLKDTYTLYPFLRSIYGDQNPFENLKSTLTAYKSASGQGIQYFFDFVVDLIHAYNDFRAKAEELDIIGVNRTRNFPRHLCLGQVDAEPGRDADLLLWRHHFEQPYETKSRQLLVREAQAYHRKINLLIANFNIPRSQGDGDIEIRVTPSQEKFLPFEQRAIPYYYNVLPSSGGEAGASIMSADADQAEAPALYQYWSISKALQGKAKANLSYHASRYADSPYITNPLRYRHEQYPFLRIEGHLGQNLSFVLNRLDALRAEHHLAFDVMALRLGEGDGSGSAGIDPRNVVLDEDSQEGDSGQITYAYDLQEDYYFLRLRFTRMALDLKYYAEELLINNLESRDQVQAWLNEQAGTDAAKVEDLFNAFFDGLEQLLQQMPADLLDLDYQEFKEAYKAALQQMIDFMMVDQRLLVNLYDFFTEARTEGDLFLGPEGINHLVKLFYQLIDLTLFARLTEIYTALQARKASAGQNVRPSDFFAFTQAHPGYTHLAGSYKNGTILMVYKQVEGDGGIDTQVVADFALPYRCCGGGSTPVFSEDFISSIQLAPFARPDYAVTAPNTALNIYLRDNDLKLTGASEVVLLSGNTTAGGSIALMTGIDGRQGVRYTPPADFKGIDTFNYRLRNRNNGLSDIGKVTVLVREDVLKAIDDDDLCATLGTALEIPVLNNDQWNRNKSIKLELIGAQNVVAFDDDDLMVKANEVLDIPVLDNDVFVKTDPVTLEFGDGESVTTIEVEVKDWNFTVDKGSSIDLSVLNEAKFNRDEDYYFSFYSASIFDDNRVTPEEVITTIRTGRLGNQADIRFRPDSDPVINYQAVKDGQDTFRYFIYQCGAVSVGLVTIEVKANQIILNAVDDELNISVNDGRSINILNNDTLDTTIPHSVDLPELRLEGVPVDNGSAVITKYTTPLGNAIELVNHRSIRSYININPTKAGTEKIKYTLKQGDQSATALLTVNIKERVTPLKVIDYATVVDMGQSSRIDFFKQNEFDQATGIDIVFEAELLEESKTRAGTRKKSYRTETGTTFNLFIPDTGLPYLNYSPAKPGKEQLAYQVTQAEDKEGATVTVTTNAEPVALALVDDSYRFNVEPIIKPIAQKLEILKNDNYVEKDPYDISLPGLELQLEDEVNGVKRKSYSFSLGSLTLVIPSSNAEAYLEFRPTAAGKVKFEYQIKQNGQQDTASVTIEVVQIEAQIELQFETFTMSAGETRSFELLQNATYPKGARAVLDFDNVNAENTNVGTGLPAKLWRTGSGDFIYLVNPTNGQQPYLQVTASKAALREAIGFGYRLTVGNSSATSNARVFVIPQPTDQITKPGDLTEVTIEKYPDIGQPVFKEPVKVIEDQPNVGEFIRKADYVALEEPVILRKVSGTDFNNALRGNISGMNKII